MSDERVLVIGESVVDVVPQPDGTTIEHPGGSPANVAVALTRLGVPVDLVTAVGPDTRGDLLLGRLESSGVRVVGDAAILPRTSTAVARLDADGAATYAFDLLTDLADPPASRDWGHIHVGSVAAVVEPGRSTVRRILASQRATVTVSYDINARPALTGSGPDLTSAVEEVCSLSDVVKTSDEDLAVVYPGASLDEGARRILALGPAAVVVTQGAAGAMCYTHDDVVRVPGFGVAVVDTIGAGDSFLATLLEGLLRTGGLGGAGTESLSTATRAGWYAVLSRANAAAAITVSRAGANPPTHHELDPVGPELAHGHLPA
jgi:fructokinase